MAKGRHAQLADRDLPGFLTALFAHVDAINTAMRGIPADQLRVHSYAAL